MYCNRMSTSHAGLDGAACLHILQAIMAQALGALKTRESSCIARSAMSFFIHEAHSSLRTS
jgi:hypothetical protein